nr:unnamed protein product [Callosobruchus analis]
MEKELTEEEKLDIGKQGGKIFYYDRKMNAAFKKDCEDLFHEYEELNSFSFDDFANVWRARNFSYIFAAQTSALSLREFCDDCFYTVKKYIAFPRSLNTQAAALYMLYGIYYKQPLKKWVSIRLTMEEFRRLLEFIQEMNNVGQLDPVYVFKKMFTDRAFIYVAARRPLGPEDRFVKKQEFYYNDTFASANTSTSLTKFKDIESLDELKHLEETTNEYQKLLEKYSEKCNGLEPFPCTIVADIKDALAEFSFKTVHKEPNIEEELKTKDAIKKRAMENKKAVYRASKKVKTALDSDEDVDDPMSLPEEDDTNESKGKQLKKGRDKRKGSSTRLPEQIDDSSKDKGKQLKTGRYRRKVMRIPAEIVNPDTVEKEKI